MYLISHTVLVCVFVCVCVRERERERERTRWGREGKAGGGKNCIRQDFC